METSTILLLFFFNDTATTEIYTLSLHDALPISVLGSTLIAMKKASIAEKQTHEREEWRRQGVGGLVSSIDPAANSIVITQQGMGEKKTDRKSTRLNSQSRLHLVCRLLLEKKKKRIHPKK